MEDRVRELAEIIQKASFAGNSAGIGLKIKKFLEKNFSNSRLLEVTGYQSLFDCCLAEFDRQNRIIKGYSGSGTNFLCQNKHFFLSELIIAGRTGRKNFFLMDTTLYPALCASSLAFMCNDYFIETNNVFNGVGVDAPYVIFNVKEEVAEKKKLLSDFGGSSSLLYSELIMMSVLDKDFILKTDDIYFPGNIFVRICNKDQGQGFFTGFPWIDDLPESFNILLGRRIILE